MYFGWWRTSYRILLKKIHILTIKNFTKSPFIKLLRFAVAIVPLAWIFLRIHWDQMAAAITSVAWWTIPLLFCVILSSMFLQGIRWWLLMRPFNRSVPLSRALKAHFVGLYYSLVLPTSAAQNVVRAMLLSRDTDYSLSWGSSWVAGVIGLLALALMTIFGLSFVNRSSLPRGFSESIISSFVVLIVLFVLSFSKRFTGPFRRLLSKFLPAGLLAIVGNIREAVYKYRTAKSNLVLVFFVTLIMQLLITTGACLIIYGISRRMILFESLCYLPIIEILCIAVPVTPNGIGLREGLLALMFLQVGLSKEQLGIYIVLGFFSISLKLVGGIPLLFDRTVSYAKVKQSAEKMPDKKAG